MISRALWIRIRERIDRYYRNKALKPGSVKVGPMGSLCQDIEDIEASSSAKVARRAGYFVLDPHHRPVVSPSDVLAMRRSLDDRQAPTWLGYVCHSSDGQFFLQLEPGACEALGWRELDRIGFRRLFSGELLTSVDRRARSEDR